MFLDFKRPQIDAAGRDIKAFYAFLMDDFYAASFAVITWQDMQAFDPKASILDAIWDGRCTLYDDFPLTAEPALYQAVRAQTEVLDDFEAIQQVRKTFEESLIAALQQLDGEGVFGNRAEDGIVLFALPAAGWRRSK